MDFFEGISKKHAPLADKMRPEKIEDFIGQSHLISDNSLLQRAIKSDNLGSCVFYGPPGVGKTTLANIIAASSKANSVYLNAVSSGVQDAKNVIKQAKDDLAMYGKKTFLILDECHRWSKTQSDSVLSAIEKGEIIFIGSTTENPYVSLTNALVSRCRIFEFRKLTNEELTKGLQRALKDTEKGLGNYDINITSQALANIVWISNGDLRSAYNILELAVLSANANAKGKIVITEETIEESTQKKALSVDESYYYDLLSAFCKSLRGSDSDAALYYSQRLIKAGCDALLIARRLIVHAAEDVGLADPYALSISTAAYTAYEKLGSPEGEIPLSEAIIYVSEAAKSNSVILALARARQAVESSDDNIPVHLKDNHYRNAAENNYKYPHDYDGGWVAQQYLPDSIKDNIFYVPSNYGQEKNIKTKKSINKGE